jgi:AbrB family looped-hinge helix DNA binding protein
VEYGPYTIQEDGQVTLPEELRREYGLRRGDAVIFERTDKGWLIRPDEGDPMRLLDELGAILTARGITLDELIASGREMRDEIVRERYGVRDEDGTPGVP